MSQAFAQAAWQDFPVAQSRLRLLGPGTAPLPTKAQELHGDPATKGTRQFLYIWDDAGGQRSYVAIRMGMISAELYSFVNFSDADIRKTILEMSSNLDPSFVDAGMLVGNSPVGGVRYQRLKFAKAVQRQCFGFGSTIGGVYFSAPSSSGVLPGGDKFIMGLYCAPNSESLSDTDITAVLAGLAFDDLKPSEATIRSAAEHRYSKGRS